MDTYHEQNEQIDTSAPPPSVIDLIKLSGTVLCRVDNSGKQQQICGPRGAEGALEAAVEGAVAASVVAALASAVGVVVVADVVEVRLFHEFDT